MDFVLSRNDILLILNLMIVRPLFSLKALVIHEWVGLTSCVSFFFLNVYLYLTVYRIDDHFLLNDDDFRFLSFWLRLFLLLLLLFLLLQLFLKTLLVLVKLHLLIILLTLQPGNALLRPRQLLQYLTIFLFNFLDFVLKCFDTALHLNLFFQ